MKTVPALPDERRLVRRLADGDPQAWGELCDAFGGPLYIYAYHLTGEDRYLAEDVRQETLLAAAQAVASFRGEVPLFSWLCGIARHKAADAVRQAARHGTPLDMDDPQVDALASESPQPDDLEESSAAVQALWSIPASYRDALLARYRDGLSVEEVASRAGRSYKATESLLSRAREALKARLMEVDGDDQ